MGRDTGSTRLLNNTVPVRRRACPTCLVEPPLLLSAVPSVTSAAPPRVWLSPALIALVLGATLLLTLDPTGDRPGLPEGPGLTTDEVLNVEPGLVLYRQLGSYGWGLLDPTSWYEVYSAPQYQHDYPPLGRLILAATHDTLQALWPVATDPAIPPRAYWTVQARAASAFALALTVFLVGWATGRWYGPLAGACAALALALMPRVFAHGHIASIETLVGLFFTATVLFTADRWPLLLNDTAATRSRWSIPWKPVVITGVLLGLTLLTKIQGVLFPVPFALWAVWRFGRRGITAVAVVGVVSALVMFIGWPWLWIDPLANIREYFGQSGRDHLYCWYQGQKLLDSDVPWHYPFVIFAVTVPVGLHLLGLVGVAAKDTSGKRSLSDSRLQLLLAVSGFSLLLFALPGVTVYDGERLFLVAYPLWAVVIGQGAGRLWELLCPASQPARRWVATAVLGGLLLAESYTLITLHPCQLSYYSWAVGGLRGAHRLGQEPTYWGDSITRELQTEITRQLPEGATLHVAPVLHPLQLPGLALQSPLLQRHRITLKSWDDRIRSEVRYVLVFRRRADFWETLEETDQPPAGLRRLAEVRREGVQLAALYEVVD